MTAPLLTAREVAETIGVSPETVLRWTRRGELPAIRLPGGQLRYDAAAVDSWLEARATSRSPGHIPNQARKPASLCGKGVTVGGSVGDSPSEPESVT